MKGRLLVLVTVLAGAAFAAAPASASHSWGDYHWARTSNPFTLLVIDANTSAWDPFLDVAIADWDRSSVMNLIEEAGSEDRK